MDKINNKENKNPCPFISWNKPKEGEKWTPEQEEKPKKTRKTKRKSTPKRKTTKKK